MLHSKAKANSNNLPIFCESLLCCGLFIQEDYVQFWDEIIFLHLCVTDCVIALVRHCAHVYVWCAVPIS